MRPWNICLQLGFVAFLGSSSRWEASQLGTANWTPSIFVRVNWRARPRRDVIKNHAALLKLFPGLARRFNCLAWGTFVQVLSWVVTVCGFLVETDFWVHFLHLKGRRACLLPCSRWCFTQSRVRFVILFWFAFLTICAGRLTFLSSLFFSVCLFSLRVARRLSFSGRVAFENFLLYKVFLLTFSVFLIIVYAFRLNNLVFFRCSTHTYSSK